jgi:hypothetical protein
MDQERRKRSEKQSISFRVGQLDDLRLLALQERHENVSLIVQRAVDREIERVRSTAEPRDEELALAS